MKKLRISLVFTVLFLLNTGIGNLSAQNRPPMPPRPNIKFANPMKKLTREQRFQVLRGSGVAVIGAGSALFTIMTKAWQRNEAKKHDGIRNDGNGLVDFYKAVGIGIFRVVGVAWIAGGTAMTIIANHKLDKMKRVTVTTNGNSIAIRYNF